MGETLALIVWGALAFLIALLCLTPWSAIGWALVWGGAIPAVMVASAWLPEAWGWIKRKVRT